MTESLTTQRSIFLLVSVIHNIWGGGIFWLPWVELPVQHDDGEFFDSTPEYAVWHTLDMSTTIASIPARPARSLGASTDERVASIVATIKVLVRELPPDAQQRVLAEITEIVRPIAAPKAGDVLGAIVLLLPQRADWTVENLKKAVGERGIRASPKEIYNALGYLTRKGRIQRLGYGRYVVDGMQVVTADDLGGAPSRHEIDDT